MKKVNPLAASQGWLRDARDSVKASGVAVSDDDDDEGGDDDESEDSESGSDDSEESSCEKTTVRKKPAMAALAVKTSGDDGDVQLGEKRDKLKATFFRNHRDRIPDGLVALFDKQEKTRGGRQANSDLINNLIQRQGSSKYTASVYATIQ